MTRIAGSIVLLACATSVAAAQPGSAPPPQQGYPPPQQGYPPPPQQGYPPPPQQGYAPPPYGYYPPAPLTAEEQEMLAEGEINAGQHVAGAALSLFLGFGSGQAVQGRWDDNGWIFTLGEIGGLALLIYGIEGDDNGCGQCETYAVVGALSFTGLRIWEIIDAIAAPSRHNDRVRSIRLRAGMPIYARVKPYVVPTAEGGGTAGLTLRF